MRVRPAVEADLPLIIAIEAGAGELFRDVDMAAVSDGELLTVEQLLPAAREGRVLVAVEDGDSPVAFVLNGWVDARAHLDHVSVDPTFAGRGLGRQLMAAAEQWGRERGSSAMTSGARARGGTRSTDTAPAIAASSAIRRGTFVTGQVPPAVSCGQQPHQDGVSKDVFGIPIYDYGEEDGQLFLTMPLINGVDLATVLAEHGPLSPRRAVRIIGQMARALELTVLD